MATEYSNIDDILMGGKNETQPSTPEHQQEFDETPDIQGVEEIESKPIAQDVDDDYGVTDDGQEYANDDVSLVEEEDEYGNKSTPDNEVIRERLARQAESLKRKHQAEIDELRAQLANQGASQQVQQAAKDFEYDPDASGDWQQQLASFVKQTVKGMEVEQQRAVQQQKEAQAHAEFETKFHQGMSKFNDFVEVVGALPITDAMTIATRGMKDPAAFLYAAAKRNPKELERISKISDPYTQMTEMGSLEARMRKTKPSTKAPRPLGRTQEDATIPHKSDKEPTIEDLIARADAKRASNIRGRVRR